MATGSQISAFVSDETRELLEQHVRATGTKKAYVIDADLRHHLRALMELPQDAILNPRIVVRLKSGKEVLDRLARPKPTAGLRKLMKSHGD